MEARKSFTCKAVIIMKNKVNNIIYHQVCKYYIEIMISTSYGSYRDIER